MLARLVDGKVHREVERLERLGDAHALVDGEAPLAVLDDDVHRVDDARPHVGEGEAAMDCHPQRVRCGRLS